MTNCIEIKGLCKSYPDFSLQNIDLTLPGGTIMGLIGENGAGKTTTIKCILNLIRRDAGEITLLGRDNLREERAAKAGVGVVLDECVFHDALRPRDLERILAPVYPTWDNGLYWDYLDKFRLPGKNLIKTFSRGMKMKLSLAAALAVNNAGIGVAAGVSGIAPGWAALANFLVTLAALPLGRALGDKLAGRLLGKYALPLSGALLVLLGIWEAVG